MANALRSIAHFPLPHFRTKHFGRGDHRSLKGKDGKVGQDIQGRGGLRRNKKERKASDSILLWRKEIYLQTK